MIRQIVITGLIATAALGLGAGVAAADIPDRGNERDIAVWACSGPGDNIVIDDDDGTTTCYQKGITTSCDAEDCVTITDDPRLSHRTNGGGARSAHTTS